MELDEVAIMLVWKEDGGEYCATNTQIMIIYKPTKASLYA